MPCDSNDNYTFDFRKDEQHMKTRNRYVQKRTIGLFSLLFFVGCGDSDSDSANIADASDSGSDTDSNTDSANKPDAFVVNGRHLYDRCGEKVVLRGVNEMVIWSGGKDGDPEFTEIAKTGANVVRIVWNNTGSADDLNTAIQNAVNAQLIPMIENHDATGDITKVAAAVDYWTQPDVVAVLKAHEPYLLLNIANEPGESVIPADFETTYKSAIERIRATGVRMPLIIDAPMWGQDIDILQTAGPGLIEHDPEHNTLFSVHMWWNDPDGTRVISELQESVDMNLPLIVGEFASHAVHLCDESPFDYKTLLAKAQELEIGWLAWSWGGVENGDCNEGVTFDMTIGGVFGNWKETWGEEVAVSDPNSIQNTSVRPASMVNGSCQ